MCAKGGSYPMATETRATGGRASGLAGVPLKCPGCGHIYGILKRNEKHEGVGIVMMIRESRLEVAHSVRVNCRCNASFWMGLGGVRKA